MTWAYVLKRTDGRVANAAGCDSALWYTQCFCDTQTSITAEVAERQTR